MLLKFFLAFHVWQQDDSVCNSIHTNAGMKITKILLNTRLGIRVRETLQWAQRKEGEMQSWASTDARLPVGIRQTHTPKCSASVTTLRRRALRDCSSTALELKLPHEVRGMGYHVLLPQHKWLNPRKRWVRKTNCALTKAHSIKTCLLWHRLYFLKSLPWEHSYSWDV